MSESWKKGGLTPDKYTIRKSTGEEVNPDADYFVLRIDTDIHARRALFAYACSVKDENPMFAEQIYDKLDQTKEKFQSYHNNLKPQADECT